MDLLPAPSWGSGRSPPLVVESVATLAHLLKCSHFIAFSLAFLCVSVLEDLEAEVATSVLFYSTVGGG